MPNLIPFLDNPTDGYELILVTAGEATFGSREEDRDAYANERPQFRADLPDYYLGKYPVRNREYAEFLEQTRPGPGDLEKWVLLDQNCQVVKVGEGYRVRGEEGVAPREAGQGETAETGWANHPVVQVSWWGAQAYCAWAGLRLPGELEWEKAARGFQGTAYPWGNEWHPEHCRNGTNCGSGRTSVIWEYPLGCGHWGHYQLAGNVWEWSADWRWGTAYQRYANGDLAPPASGNRKVLRGGSWSAVNPRGFRGATRAHDVPDERFNSSIGFRCARGPV